MSDQTKNPQTENEAPGQPAEPPITPEAHIGHVHLKVADLERSERFYTEALGFEVTERFGHQAVFMSAGGYHHHIAINTWESLNGSPPPFGTTGLYHFAIVYPNRKELARALKRLLDHGVEIDGAGDHGVSESIYLHDPDGNGIELYVDRPRGQWPHYDNYIRMVTRPFDLEGLLAELD